MGSPTLVTEILPENYRFLQAHIYSQVGIVLESDPKAQCRLIEL